MKMAKKKIFVSLLLIVVAATAVGLGTFALFTSTDTSGPNTFSAGDLILSVEGDDPVGGTISWATPAGWAPGDTESGNLTLRNTGSIAATSTLMTVTNTIPEPAADLAPAVIITDMTYDGVNILAAVRTQLGDVDADLRLSELAELSTGVEYDLGGLPGGGSTKVLAMTFTFDSTAGDGYQGAATNMEIGITLQQ